MAERRPKWHNEMQRLDSPKCCWFQSETGTIIYLEPKWPLFLKVNPPKQGLFQSKQGSFGFQVYYISPTQRMHYHFREIPQTSPYICHQVWSTTPNGCHLKQVSTPQERSRVGHQEWPLQVSHPHTEAWCGGWRVGCLKDHPMTCK